MVRKYIFVLCCVVVWNSSANACVQLNTGDYWNSSSLVVIGLVSKASLFYKDDYPYVRYSISDPLTLKGKTKSSRNLKVFVKANYPTLRAGVSFIAFVNENGYVDYCGPTQLFEDDWLNVDYGGFGTDEENVFVNDIRDLVANENRK